MKEYRSGLDVPRVRGLARFDPADHWSEEGLENVSNDHADDLGLIARQSHWQSFLARGVLSRPTCTSEARVPVTFNTGRKKGRLLNMLCPR